MKTALDNYEVGKQKEVSADDFSFVVRDSYRFLCPECLEPVSMYERVYGKFFRHRKKTPSSIECDRRTEAMANKSIFERLGLPLFIRKDGNKYNLFLGFKALPQSVIDFCERENAFVVIKNQINSKFQKYYINYENFSSEFISYKKIENLCSGNLIIEYSTPSVEKLVSPFWSNYIETSVVTKGAIAHNGNNGGKIIRVGDSISTYKQYFWIRPSNNYYNFYYNDGCDFTRVGEFNVSDKHFEVYEGKFTVKSSDAIAFNRLANYLHERLGLFLLEGEASIIPIWPPCVKTEIGYELHTPNNLFYLINSNNNESREYIYTENNPCPVCLKPENINNYIFGKTNISNLPKIINVDRRVVSSGSYIQVKKPILKNNYNYFDDGLEIRLIEYDYLENLNFKFNCKAEAYIVNNNFNIKRILFESGNVYFEKNNQAIMVWVVCNKKIVAICQKHLEKDENQISIRLLKKMLQSTSDSKKVKINQQEYQRLSNLIKDDKSLKRWLVKYKNSGKIPIQVAQVLRRNK